MGKEHRFVVVIQKLEIKKNVISSCEKGGKYKQYKDKLVCKTTGTRKYECPFILKWKFVRTIWWRLTIEYGP